jgi:hypothetical protein
VTSTLAITSAAAPPIIIPMNSPSVRFPTNLPDEPEEVEPDVVVVPEEGNPEEPEVAVDVTVEVGEFDVEPVEPEVVEFDTHLLATGSTMYPGLQ